MVELDHLSAIGFGCYRVSVDSSEHYDALRYALSQGCNVIDTSANYVDGKSEELVGKVLAENPEYDAFVITKAGYIQGRNLKVVEGLVQNGLDKDELVSLSSDSMYSIDPSFLESQIELSSLRLQRPCIDGFLLHNPEHYFDQKGVDTSQTEYNKRIKRAFEFLEEQVSEGRIRYYGISSNTFPFSSDRKTTTNLCDVLSIANGISRDNHFKLIQFPFNLVETDAIFDHHANRSLVEIAKENRVVTFGNRPLNAQTASGFLRLATYEDAIRQIDESSASLIFGDCLTLIRKQLLRIGESADPMDYSVMRSLRDNWMKIDNPEAVTQIFQTIFYPFLYRIYQGQIPVDALRVFSSFYDFSMLHSRKKLTEKANIFRREKIREGVIGKSDDRPLAIVVCESYLNSGIDHVLVGMRKVKYVRMLEPLFFNRQSS